MINANIANRMTRDFKNDHRLDKIETAVVTAAKEGLFVTLVSNDLINQSVESTLKSMGYKVSYDEHQGTLISWGE